MSEADVIVSNPPYINTDVIDTLSPQVRSEPRLALDGGRDGMRFYNRFITDYTRLMKPGAVMLLEIGYDQAERVRALCGSAGVSCAFIKDYSGIDRIAVVG